MIAITFGMPATCRLGLAVRLGFLTSVLIACAPLDYAADWEVMPQSSIQTIVGEVHIVWGEKGARVVSNGKTLLQSSDPDALSLGPSFPDASAAKLVLVSIGENGEACPELYRVIEFVKDKPPVVSSEFGNCNVLAVPSWWKGPFPSTGNPYFQNGKWFIGIPSQRNSLSLEWWAYSDGQVSHIDSMN